MSDQKQQNDERAEQPARRDHASRAAALGEEAEQLRHDAQTLRALQQLTDIALSSLSLEALLPELLERLQSVMQVDNAAILTLDEQTQELVVRAARGPEENAVGQVRIPMGRGFAGRIAATRKPLFVEDVSTFPVSNPILREGLRSLLGVPLLIGDRVLGVAHIDSATPRTFTAADTALLEQVADRIARAIERAQLYEAAETARRAAEERAAFLSATLAALGDGLVIVDTEGHVLYSNPAFAALQGASPGGAREDEAGEADDGVARDALESARLRQLDVRDAHGILLPPQEFATARALRGETLAGPTALDVQIHRLDGQEAALSLSAGPVRSPSGELLGAVMAMRDVTERRRLEQRAHEASRRADERTARLEAIFSSLTDGLFVYDADGRTIEQNAAANTMQAAFAPPETRGATVFERGRRIAGGLRDAATGRSLPVEEWPQTRIAEGATLSGPTSVDIRLWRRDGGERYLNVSGAPLRDNDGAIVGSVCLYRDVTDRWMLNETLQRRTGELEAANLQLRTLVEVLPVGATIVDAEGKLMLVNNAARRIWGQELLPGETLAQYGEYRAWRAETGELVANDEWGLMRALRHGEVSVGAEYDIETFDGQRRTILDSAAPLRDEAGAISGAVSVIFDITERRQLELRTRDALEAFIAITRTLVEAPDDGAETVETTKTKESGAAEGAAATDSSLAEYRRNESPIARRLAELTRGILGCRLVAVSAVEDVDGQLYDHPYAIVGMTPEQERKWWADQLALQPHAFLAGMLPEDAARLHAGEVFTADLTRPPYNIHNDYGVTAILAAAMRTQGRIVGLLALDFEEPDQQPHAFTPEEIQIAAAVARLGAVVLERDRLLREREAARTEALALTEANRRMDEFLGIAGHELRTPLTTVKANLQLAERRARQIITQLERLPHAGATPGTRGKERGPLEQLLRLLARATFSVDRQERLVQDLLDISRISSGRLEYRMAPLDLTELAREIVEEQRLSAPGRRIELEAPDGRLWVVGDADRLGQVLTNYLTNALKYSDTDRPVIVALRREDADVRVETRDQGPGLTAAQQKRVFERFYRAPGIEVVSGSGIGLGLGLYISMTIVEQHDGAVGVESAPGQGSVFWFTVPARPQEHE